MQVHKPKKDSNLNKTKQWNNDAGYSQLHLYADPLVWFGDLISVVPKTKMLVTVNSTFMLTPWFDLVT